MGSVHRNSTVREANAGETKASAATKNGMTQKELSELSGVPLARLRRIERGTQSVTLDDLVKLARALGCDPLDMCKDALVRGGEIQPDDTPGVGHEPPPASPSVPFLRQTEEPASKVLRQLQSIYGELDLVQDLLHVCSGACNAEVVDMDVRDAAHVLRRCGSDRLFSAQKSLTKIIERFGGRTEMSEQAESACTPEAATGHLPNESGPKQPTEHS